MWERHKSSDEATKPETSSILGPLVTSSLAAWQDEIDADKYAESVIDSLILYLKAKFPKGDKGITEAVNEFVEDLSLLGLRSWEDQLTGYVRQTCPAAAGTSFQLTRCMCEPHAYDLQSLSLLDPSHPSVILRISEVVERLQRKYDTRRTEQFAAVMLGMMDDQYKISTMSCPEDGDLKKYLADDAVIIQIFPALEGMRGGLREALGYPDPDEEGKLQRECFAKVKLSK
jgi:hypothetical protein